MDKIITMVAAALLAAATTIFQACEKPVQTPVSLEVSVKTPQVSHEAGQMFVNVVCDSEWSISIETASEEWASLNTSSGKGNKANVVLSYQENKSDESRELAIVLRSGKAESSCTLVQRASGESPSPDPTPVTDLSSKSWLELPALSDPHLVYLSHDFTMDGKVYRNYSFGYSSEDGVSLWVAYPLCKMYTNKSVSRTDAWAQDPLLGNDSPAPFGGYAEELARGHQLPSADRLCCREANEQTFYGTNMTPQMNEHNEGIWANLENSVRTWANTSDTTFVVTGCILKGSTRVTTDSYGKLLTVPSAYYKAVVRYSRSSTIAQWAGAAFFTEHRDYGKAPVSKEISMSIDRLEEITGIDFFVNLPAKLGNAMAAEIESQNPADCAIWW